MKGSRQRDENDRRSEDRRNEEPPAPLLAIALLPLEVTVQKLCEHAGEHADPESACQNQVASVTAALRHDGGSEGEGKPVIQKKNEGGQCNQPHRKRGPFP